MTLLKPELEGNNFRLQRRHHCSVRSLLQIAVSYKRRITVVVLLVTGKLEILYYHRSVRCVISSDSEIWSHTSQLFGEIVQDMRLGMGWFP